MLVVCERCNYINIDKMPIRLVDYDLDSGHITCDTICGECRCVIKLTSEQGRGWLDDSYEWFVDYKSKVGPKDLERLAKGTWTRLFDSLPQPKGQVITK